MSPPFRSYFFSRPFIRSGEVYLFPHGPSQAGLSPPPICFRGPFAALGSVPDFPFLRRVIAFALEFGTIPFAWSCRPLSPQDPLSFELFFFDFICFFVWVLLPESLVAVAFNGPHSHGDPSGNLFSFCKADPLVVTCSLCYSFLSRLFLEKVLLLSPGRPFSSGLF